MRMNAVLSNPKHPEYGQFTVPLPIPHNQYDGIMEALNAMDMGDPLARDCQMDEILGEYPILKRLEGKPVNIDELDYLAKRLDSFCYAQEGAQFQGAAVSYDYGNDLDGSELRDYQSCIHEALLENQMPEEKNRGLMHWYDKPDGVNTKVQSVMLDVESRDGQLWGVAECKVNGTLLPEEKEALAEYISGQASDGWGEGFEQRAIKLNDGELYVSLWNSSNWSIQTEEERFSPDSLTRLPDLCWSVLPGEGTLICIKRGESGYYRRILKKGRLYHTLR